MAIKLEQICLLWVSTGYEFHQEVLKNEALYFFLYIIISISYILFTVACGGWDSIVGTATHYRLDIPGIKSWWGKNFHILQTSPGAHPAYTVGTGSFPGVQQPEWGIDHPPPSSAEVKKKE